MGVVREFRELPGVIRRLTAAIQAIAELERGNAPAEARLEELERSRSLWEAEVRALILKAESTYRSASNAESRARTMEKAYEKHADPFPEDGEELEETLPRGYEPTGEEEGVHAVPVGLAPVVGKTNALNRKFMR